MTGTRISNRVFEATKRKNRKIRKLQNKSLKKPLIITIKDSSDNQLSLEKKKRQQFISKNQGITVTLNQRDGLEEAA